ncbi:MAG: ComEC/Rec2 family competence protein [Oligoflexia bacterium]|nr:ComEC/Rec2 family competence protein [Oligoflexia bacterium]
MGKTISVPTAWKRSLARWRSTTPSLLIVPSFLLGQLLFFHGLMPLVPLVIAMSLAVMGLLLALGARALFFVALAAGACSAFPLNEFWSHGNYPRSDTSFVAVVVGEPRFRRVGGIEIPLRLLQELVLDKRSKESPETIPAKGYYLCRAIYLPWRNASKLKQGSAVVVRGAWRTFTNGYWPFSFEQRGLRHGESGTCKLRYISQPLRESQSLLARFRESLRANVEKILGPGQRSGLVLSLLLGFRDVLSDETEESFRRAGLAHLTVLSGHQITILFVSLLTLLRWIIARFQSLHGSRMLRPICAQLGLLISFVAVAVTDFETSATRAFVAVACVVWCWTFESRGSPAQSLLLALFGINILWPACFLDVGTQLTFAALSGILLAETAPLSNAIARSIYACTLASLSSMLVCLCWFPQISLIGLILNPIVAPIVSVLACDIGLPCVLVSLLGVEFPLRYLAALLDWSRLGLRYCSDFEWAAFEPSLLWRAVCVLTLCVLLGCILLQRLRESRQRHNLWAVSLAGD